MYEHWNTPKLSEEIPMIRIASFNVENLFARPEAFDLPDWNAGEPVLNALHVTIANSLWRARERDRR